MYSGVIRDTYDELLAERAAKKKEANDKLKSQLIIVILILIVIIAANCWFIWHRWQTEREQEWNINLV